MSCTCRFSFFIASYYLISVAYRSITIHGATRQNQPTSRLGRSLIGSSLLGAKLTENVFIHTELLASTETYLTENSNSNFTLNSNTQTAQSLNWLGYRLEERRIGFRPPTDASDFSLHRRFQSLWSTKYASTGGFFPRYKRPGWQSGQCLETSTKIRNKWSYRSVSTSNDIICRGTTLLDHKFVFLLTYRTPAKLCLLDNRFIKTSLSITSNATTRLR